jgi:hypothetical protein
MIPTFLLWIFFCVAAALFASQRRNRSGVGWFFVAFFFSPLVAFVLLAILHPLTLLQDNLERRRRASSTVLNKVELWVCGVILSLALLGWAVSALAQQQTFRDASGRSVGTATNSGNQTTFRDARGRSTGTATVDSGGTTTFRDARGNVTGRSTLPSGKR